MRIPASRYHRHRLPAEIISHCVWICFRFALSFRDVEEMLAMRGVVLTYETVREWCLKFGQTYANDLRRRSPRPGDRWHLDEVFLKINGRIHYLWRAVDQDGDVLDILVQNKRDKKAVKKFCRGRDASWPSAPRTDPYVQHYCIRLLPRMLSVKAQVGMRMFEVRTGDPSNDQSPEPIQGHLAPLTSAAKRAVPPPDYLGPKAVETIQIAGHRIIVEVTLHH